MPDPFPIPFQARFGEIRGGPFESEEIEIMSKPDPKKDPNLKATKAEREQAEGLGREAFAAGIIAPAIDKRCMALLDGEGRVVGQPRTIQIFKAWSAGYTAALLAAPVEDAS